MGSLADLAEKCHNCDKQVLHCVTPSGSPIQMELTPDPSSSYAVEYRGTELKPLARLLTTAKKFGYKTFYKSHPVNCRTTPRTRSRES